MKVTKMKRGYIIRLSDSEFDLLSGEMQYEFMSSGTFVDADWKHLPPAQQRVLTEIANNERDWLAVTENRRK
jgi:hypothetical protein